MTGNVDLITEEKHEKALLLVTLVAAVSFAACSKKEETTTARRQRRRDRRRRPTTVVVTPPRRRRRRCRRRCRRRRPPPQPRLLPPQRLGLGRRGCRESAATAASAAKAALFMRSVESRLRAAFCIASRDDDAQAIVQPAEAAHRVGDDDVLAAAAPARRPAPRERARAGCSRGSGARPPHGAGRRATQAASISAARSFARWP